ncbi:MAG: M20/M25/M40 family metallo-hydrolase [Acidobacteria bacterium]|nr:M20/M25/M40 family metallo-hydrolase [Acidobacteriota bacterium]
MANLSRIPTRFMAASLVTGLLVISTFVATRAQSGPTAPADRWRQAVNDWETGDYHQALPHLLAIMRSPAAAEYLERVALLTGEYYPSVTIANDGRAPRLSADGRLVIFETGPASAPITRIIRVPDGASAAPTQAAELQGAGVAVNAAGTHVVWIRPPQSAEWTAAQQALAAPGPITPERQAVTMPAAWLTATSGDIVVRDLASGTERVIATPGLAKTSPAFAADNRSVFFIGADVADLSRSDLYLVSDVAAPQPLTTEPGFKTLLAVDPKGAALLYNTGGAAPFRRPPTAPAAAAPAGQAGQGAGRAGGAGRVGGPGGGASASFAVLNLATRSTRIITGTAPTLSADGSTIAWINRTADAYTINTSPTLSGAVTVVRTGRERLDAPSLSPDGRRVAYQLMQFTDWELYISEGTTHIRVTRDIQHDILPRFLTSTTLIGMMGEPRHRRSQVYDLTTGTRRRLFHNNTIRTVVPEYTWLPSADGSRVLIVADRDGDTVSPERGIYVSDLSRTINVNEVIARLTANLAHETELRDRTRQAFAPIAAAVRSVTSAGSVTRVFEHAKALYDFDSKHITQPGNAKAIDYLMRAYASFGYTPEQQSFTQANALGGKTANVLATLRGTVDPDLIYVVSSHFDSVAIGPGADDDTSGTTALLEAARMLARTPMPATIVFASFTGEEAGLLGSREFVRRSAEAKWNVVGALNNDMIGWAGEGPQLNNTIRYSNPGIRDIQHGAAIQFTDIVLFDTKYYRGTDAQAFYDAWGDIVGGIGSYPILANPHYHQPTDYLDTINQVQVTETAKVTAATLMYLASSPSRLKGLAVTKAASGVSVTWTASPETGIRHYIVAYGPENDPLRTRVIVTRPTIALPSLPAGTRIAVKAVNAKGLEGWDWAWTRVE